MTIRLYSNLNYQKSCIHAGNCRCLARHICLGMRYLLPQQHKMCTILASSIGDIPDLQSWQVP
jgi:hypothetical protein